MKKKDKGIKKKYSFKFPRIRKNYFIKTLQGISRMRHKGKTMLGPLGDRINILPSACHGKCGFSLFPVLPQLIIIALCVALYYAMIYLYLFFSWGFYLYYAIKLIIAFAILSASRRSLLLPLVALLIGVSVLFTNARVLNNLMSADTASALIAVSLAGILISIFFRKRLAKK